MHCRPLQPQLAAWAGHMVRFCGMAKQGHAASIDEVPFLHSPELELPSLSRQRSWEHNKVGPHDLELCSEAVSGV